MIPPGYSTSVVNELRVIRINVEMAREYARDGDTAGATMMADRAMRSLQFLIAALDVREQPPG